MWLTPGRVSGRKNYAPILFINTPKEGLEYMTYLFVRQIYFVEYGIDIELAGYSVHHVKWLPHYDDLYKI